MTTEGGALGAALLAAVGAGWYPSAAEAADKVVQLGGTWDPHNGAVSRYESVYAAFCRVHDALHPLWDEWCG
jgi:xylulokinase